MTVKTIDMQHYFSCNSCWLQTNNMFRLLGIKLGLALRKLEKEDGQMCWLCYMQGRMTKAIGYLELAMPET